MNWQATKRLQRGGAAAGRRRRPTRPPFTAAAARTEATARARRLLPAAILLLALPLTAVWGQAEATDGAPQGESSGVRIKEIASVEGVRHNQLVGFGLVTGLDGQGDSSRSELVKQLLANSLSAFGMEIEARKIESRNSAVVMVTAETPSFVRPGQSIDVSVASVQDARSLDGGQLMQTPLKGANGTVYAVAQGRIDVRVRPDEEGNRTVGRIVDGALVEREIASRYAGGRSFSLVLRRPDFATAAAVASALAEELELAEAVPLDAGKIRVDLAAEDTRSLVEVIARAERVMVEPGRSGEVVINRRSGVVVAGKEVKIAPVSVAYREAQLSIGSYSPSGGEENGGAVALEQTTRVADLVSLLKDAGLSIDDIIEIMKTIERAGALYGTLVVM